MGWSKIGGPAHSLAIYADRVAALTPDRQKVFALNPSTGVWDEIGGPAEALIGGGWDLYALSPGGQELWRYDGSIWQKAGGPGAQFVGIGSSMYALNPDCSKVFRYHRYTMSWSEIGGPAQALIGGGSKLYAAAPGNTAIHEYDRSRGRWQKIGGAGAMWAGVNGTVYGLAPDKSAVYRYDGTPEQWTKVGGPAANLIGGGAYIHATQPGTGRVFRYSGTGEHWEEVSAPGAGFVAVGRSLYGMTTDRREVHRYVEDNAESQRLRDIMVRHYSRPAFGNRVMRGFLVKPLGKPALVEHNSDTIFQPLSSLKLLPYLHALIEVDKSADADLTNFTVSWVQRTTGTPEEINDTSCLAPGSVGTVDGSATYADALPTMMWESHGRTQDAFLNNYHPHLVTSRARSLGLTQTEMYTGCPLGDQRTPWADNVSTLADFARLFEGVENHTFLTKLSTRDAFRQNMINLTARPGTSYTSPITGRLTGPFDTEFLRPIVVQEAGAAKAGIVDAFMSRVALRGKGGSGGPDGTDVGRSDMLQLNLPFKIDGEIKTRKFFVGWYVCLLFVASPAVAAALQAEDQAFAEFKVELHRLPIQMALATW